MNGRESTYRGFGSRLRFDELDILPVDVASPAAGANASYIVQSMAVRVLAARATLTTDANVANRLISLDYIDARGVTRVRNMPTVLVTANTSNQTVVWSGAYKSSEWNTGTPVFVPVLDCILDIGYTLRFTVDSIQATDQLAALSLLLLTIPTGYDAPA